MGLATGTSVLTFGLSSILFVVSAASVASGTAQCINSGVRVVDQTFNKGELSRLLDSEEWYNNTISAIDKIGIATTAVGVGGTFRTLKSLKVDFLTYGAEAVRITLKRLTPSNKIEISKEIVRKNHPMVNNAFFSTIINGPLSKRAISSTAFDKANISDLIDALSTSLAVTGNIKTNGTLNPKAKTIDGLSIGVLTGIDK